MPNCPTVSVVICAHTEDRWLQLKKSGPEVVDRVIYGEDRWVTACEREATGVVVLVHVNDLGLPSAKSSPYLEGSWIRERAD